MSLSCCSYDYLRQKNIITIMSTQLLCSYVERRKCACAGLSSLPFSFACCEHFSESKFNMQMKRMMRVVLLMCTYQNIIPMLSAYRRGHGSPTENHATSDRVIDWLSFANVLSLIITNCVLLTLVTVGRNTKELFQRD